MVDALTEDQREHLLSFVGYGALTAPLWFLGMEEAGGGEENLRIRAKFRTVEDLKEAHQMLGITKHHAGAKVLQPTWNAMCEIALILHGVEEPDREMRRQYQVDHLGRLHGATLLAELMPIPKPSIGDWDYPIAFPHYQTADHYYADVLPRRIEYLRELAQKWSPQVVVGYGAGFWNHYQRVFSDMKFETSGDFAWAQNDDRVVILSHHLTSRTMNNRHYVVAELIKLGLPDFVLPWPQST